MFMANLTAQEKDFCTEVAHEFKLFYEKHFQGRVFKPDVLEAIFIGYCFDRAGSFTVHEFAYSFQIVKDILPIVSSLRIVK